MSEQRLFRPFKQDDFPELCAMSCALYKEDDIGHEMSEKKIRATVEALSNSPERGEITLFLQDGQAAGYAIVVYFWSNEYGGKIGILDEMFVKKTFRGKGLGGLFLDRISQSSDESIVALRLEVTQNNERAFSLYEKKGFHLCRNRHMEKSLRDENENH